MILIELNDLDRNSLGSIASLSFIFSFPIHASQGHRTILLLSFLASAHCQPLSFSRAGNEVLTTGSWRSFLWFTADTLNLDLFINSSLGIDHQKRQIIIYNYFSKATQSTMNFAQWGGKLIPNLKGLDELAQEDDYVNSDGLNVQRYDSDDDEQETTSLVQAPVSSMHSPLHNQEEPYHGSGLEQPSQMLSVAQGHEALPVRKPQGVLEIEMSESSDHEDALSSSTPNNYHNHSNSINGSKKHRFMQDLDDRLAKEEPPQLPSAIPLRNVRVSLSSSSTPSSMNNNPVRKLASIFGFQKPPNASSNVDQSSSNSDHHDEESNGSALPPLSKERLRPKRSNSSYPSQHIDKVSSNNMLNADDLLALQQMKQLTDAQNEFDLRQFLQTHSRESFIALTLLLSVAVYFFGRRFSVEDDIH